jgi:hypothetical protein
MPTGGSGQDYGCCAFVGDHNDANGEDGLVAVRNAGRATEHPWSGRGGIAGLIRVSLDHSGACVLWLPSAANTIEGQVGLHTK